MSAHTFTIAAIFLAGATQMSLGQDAADEMKKFEGTWEIISTETNGVVRQSSNGVKYRFTGDTWETLNEDRVVTRGKFRVDPTTSPKRGDMFLEDDQSGTRTRHFIFEIDGDTLTMCLTPIGKPHPTQFTGKAGSGQALANFRRETR